MEIELGRGLVELMQWVEQYYMCVCAGFNCIIVLIRAGGFRICPGLPPS